MSTALDMLGPQAISLNGGTPLALRPTISFSGGVALSDDAPQSRSRLFVPDNRYQVVSVDALDLSGSGELTPWIVGFSSADLVRLDNWTADANVVGFADVKRLPDGDQSVQAIPRKLIKYVANVGGEPVTLQPPAAPLADPDIAGILLDIITLDPNDCVRIMWDSIELGYRILVADALIHAYVTYEGTYVVLEGRHIFRRG